MRRKLIIVFYITLILLMFEAFAYMIIGYIASGYHKMMWARFNDNIKISQDISKEVPYAGIINRYAHEAGLNPILIAALIKAESSYQPRAVSKSGAYGLMQVMPDTWRQINKQIKACVGRHSGECTSECYYNAELNIRIGVGYLASLVSRYPNNVILAIAAYNAGPGAIEEYGGIPPYYETKEYVGRVVKYAYSYENKEYPKYITIADEWEKVQSAMGYAFIATIILIVGMAYLLKRCHRSWRWR